MNTNKISIDTNILFYAFDARDNTKKKWRWKFCASALMSRIKSFRNF